MALFWIVGAAIIYAFYRSVRGEIQECARCQDKPIDRKNKTRCKGCTPVPTTKDTIKKRR
ncbi:hypothetical protein COY28_06380 [Candidatus Woesearchaeota archaeon CG_4_10_14_0_2_um_filter_57_5]|nr:MAG: hypothetical protein AUJ68_03810 [Candidatus Woesearchaeota archaeon CG1_02_57_44]PIZ49412.1 MAG: hypothetical protein COY28_06380 [Candidatus Woesearchaeota archaeon CG_4_10_14_0_2_um_filter_57_5]